LDESNTKLFPRFFVEQVKAALIDTPVVMVTRPRQCGKTTRVRGFTSHRYITLDDDTVLEAARGDPSGFVRGLDQAIVDEVQRAPDLLRLCKGKNRIVVEYALRDTGKPMGVDHRQSSRH
jgi:predicted AAA+ superfamily ATPase